MEMLLSPIPMVLIHFARVCSNVDDFIDRNLFMTANMVKDIIKLEKHFLN